MKENKEQLLCLGHKQQPILKVIRLFCKECCGDSDWKVCSSKNCQLYPYRDGKNPFNNRIMTDEQKKQASERMKSYLNRNK